jgi:hypothetical protein
MMPKKVLCQCCQSLLPVHSDPVHDDDILVRELVEAFPVFVDIAPSGIYTLESSPPQLFINEVMHDHVIKEDRVVSWGAFNGQSGNRLMRCPSTFPVPAVYGVA